MIVKVDKIPEAPPKMSQRESLRRDFQYAMDNHIEEFEIVGEEYNHQYLAQYAREEAKRLTRRIFRPKLRELELKHDWKYLSVPSKYEQNYFIKITTVEGRVYCKIDYSCIGTIMHEIEEAELKKEKERERLYDASKGHKGKVGGD